MMQRVNYFERQILTADALNQEQGYRLLSHRQHNLANHDWGILQGLYFYKQDRELWLAPGVAVDGYGRELWLSEPFPIRRELFTALYREEYERQERVVDLWLRYAREENAISEKGLQNCEPGQGLRAREEARLCVTRPLEDADGKPVAIDPRRPTALPVEDLDFPPFREPPDDPDRSWPVYLGRIRWSAETDEIRFDDRAHLPYANLVGALLRSASRQPGPEDAQALSAPAPVERARVEMAPMLSGRPPFGIYCADPKSNLVRRLAVLGSGNLHARGHTIVASDLTEQERLQMQPGEQENGKLSTLHIKERPIRFTQSMIKNPERLARKLNTGALPLSAALKKSVRNSIDELFLQPQGTPDEKRKLREGLAEVLNEIVNQEPLIASSRTPNLRLRPGTWELFRSLPRGTQFAALNARVVKDVFATELSSATLLAEGYAVEVAPLGVPETKQAMPWNLYRIEKQDESGATSTELRFESFDPGDKDDPTLYQFVIGKGEGIPEDGRFEPCLSVDAACNVTVHGQLIVEGELIQSPVQVDPTDPRYVDQLYQSWEQGVSAALAASSSLEAEISNIVVADDLQSWTYDLTIKNIGEVPITNVLFLDTFSIQGRVSPTLQRGRQNLLIQDQNPPFKVAVKHDSSQPPLTRDAILYIVASIQGRLPNGLTAYANAKGQLFIPLRAS